MTSRIAVAALLAGIAAAAVVAAGSGVPGGESALAKAEPATLAKSQRLKKSIWGETELQGRSLFPTYRKLGVGLYSIAARWDWIARERPRKPRSPGDPAYRWPPYLTEAIAGAREHGLEVQVMVLGAPRWANGGRSWKWAPKRPSDYADFMTAASRRYPSVKLWMIWGEPNRAPNFAPLTPSSHPTGPLSAVEQVAPRNYARLLDAAYGALKRVDRRDLVIGGNTFIAAGADDINPYQWIDYMLLPDGTRPRLDMWGHNPFGFHQPDLSDPPAINGAVAFQDLARLAARLDATFPGPPLRLFLAEWGVPQGFRDKDLGYSLEPSEAKRWIRAGYAIARSWDRIYTLGWVHPIDTERSSMGLLTRRGKRKPAFDAFAKS